MNGANQLQSSPNLHRIALRALALVLVIPSLAVFYAFRDDLAGKEVILLLLAFLVSLGFYLLWTILRGVVVLQSEIEKLSLTRQLLAFGRRQGLLGRFVYLLEIAMLHPVAR